MTGDLRYKVLARLVHEFAWLCELLGALDDNRIRKASSTGRAVNLDHQVIISWFNRYSHLIDRHGIYGIAFISCLFPERRPDRVYNLQKKALSRVFGRALLLGVSRAAQLNDWRNREGADFPTCVERVMRDAEFDIVSPGKAVTLDEVDQALDQIAANSAFSSHELRQRANDRDPSDILRPILKRLQSHEAKWLARMLLKNLSPIQVPEHLALHQFHFLLPSLLAIQNTIHAAVKALGRAVTSELPPRPAKEYEQALKMMASKDLVPQIGIMIRRQPYDKARSIKHCCQMAGSRRMSLERKYDGEYCQVHIDLSRGGDCIQIFSKSGKDSTLDRVRLHGAIHDGLKLGTRNCLIKEHCILEGELIVWSKSQQAIQPFHKIRKHVKHGGRWLGNTRDSPAAPDENLMIVFYDVLLLDGSVCISHPQQQRRVVLEKLVRIVAGCVDIGHREVIDFRSRKAPEQLRAAFARAITGRWEGYVLKGCDDPYFSWSQCTRGIKLKKDYIAGLGDTADLAIVGGRHCHQVEQELGLGKVHWTSFYIACLENKAVVQRFDTKPVYRILDEVTQHGISKEDIKLLNELGNFRRLDFTVSSEEIEVKTDAGLQNRPSHLFKSPFIVDVMGAGFDKPSNASFYTLRFPRVVKIHHDRACEDVISFEELQNMAKVSMTSPEDVDSQEDRNWIERLIRADGKSAYIVDKSQSTTPGKSSGTASTASVSPNLGTKRKPPSLIRVDTSEMSPRERLFRKYEKLTEQPKPLPPAAEATRGSKRKLVAAESPVLPNSSKSVKLDVVATTAPSLAHEQENYDRNRWNRLSIVSATPTPAARASTRSSTQGLKKTPPWCKRPQTSIEEVPVTTKSSDPVTTLPQTEASHRFASTGRSVSGNCGTLSEIVNVSASRSRRSPHNAGTSPSDAAIGRGSPKLRPSQNLRTQLQSILAPSEQHVEPSRNGQDSLPTPPTSSPTEPEPQRDGGAGRECGDALPESRNRAPLSSTESDVRDSKTVVSEPRGKNHDLSNHSPSKPSADVMNTSQSEPLPAIPSILFSNSFLRTIGSHKSDNIATLQHTPASFTMSPDYFVDDIIRASTLTSPLQLSVVLVDWTQPNAVAQDMKSLGQLLHRNLSNLVDRVVLRGAILFLHQTYLMHGTNGTMGVDVQGGRKYFCGCLRWSHTRDGTRITAIWVWDTAIAI